LYLSTAAFSAYIKGKPIQKELPMTTRRVWILFEPQIYCDLFSRILQAAGLMEIISAEPEQGRLQEGGKVQATVDVIIYSLDNQGEPELAKLPEPPPEAKLLAFSPKGDFGLRRMPGEKYWEEVRPFGVSQLIQEVEEGRKRPMDSAGLINEWLANNTRLKPQLRRKS
jgi:hypothetical protein